MKKQHLFLAAVIASMFITACSGEKDTARMTPQQHYEYAMELYNEEDYLSALNQFQKIKLQYPGNPISDDTQFFLGMTYFKQEKYLLAAYEFSRLITNLPASSFVPNAQYMLAEAYYMLSPQFPLDQSYTVKARDEFQAFIDFFPTNSQVPEAEKKIAEMNTKLAHKDYNSAVIYEKMDYLTASLLYYDRVINNYHDTEYAPMALQRKIDLHMQQDEEGKALNEIAIFISRYPNHPDLDKVKNLQDRILN